MRGELTIVVVDDEAPVRHLLQEALTASGHRVLTADSGAEALRVVRAEPCDVVLLDLKMPGMSGLEVLETLKGGWFEGEVVTVTGDADVDSAVTAMKLGAHDYLRKPFSLTEVDRALRRAAQCHRSKEPPVALEGPSSAEGSRIPVLVGTDPKIVAVRTLVERIAVSDATVLITGETGTGKEVVARLIHARSLRAAGPLVVVDCPSVPTSLFETELFGHERGAFTGALTRRKGKVEAAAGGTLFLDEVADLPLEVQGKCLRFLQERQVTRVGANRAIGVNVRVISASNRDLAALVGKGTLREDLFHRLNVVQVELPPLRERRADVPLLAAHFVERFCQAQQIPTLDISPPVLEVFAAHTWPGNVRELENVIQRACILTSACTITPDSLPPGLLQAVTASDNAPVKLPDGVADLERRRLLGALRQQRGNVSRAARVLGIHRATLYRKLMALGLRSRHDAETGTGS